MIDWTDAIRLRLGIEAGVELCRVVLSCLDKVAGQCKNVSLCPPR